MYSFCIICNSARYVLCLNKDLPVCYCEFYLLQYFNDHNICIALRMTMRMGVRKLLCPERSISMSAGRSSYKVNMREV